MTPVSFEGARYIAAEATGERIERYGWENAEVFVLVVDYGLNVPKGVEIPVVVKATGQLRWEVSARGEPVAASLRSVGSPD